MLEQKGWEEFRSAGLLWWINRGLHLFGWVIVCSYDSDSGELTEVYPARCKYRGFAAEDEEAGFIALSRHIKDNAEELLKEAVS